MKNWLYALGGCSLLLAAAGSVGWIVGPTGGSPGHVMTWGAALGFGAAGLALVLVARDRFVAAQVVAGCIGLVGLVSLAQWIGTEDVDAIATARGAKTIFPIPLSPQGAVGLAAFAFALLLARARPVLSAIAATVVLVIAASPLLGKLAGIDEPARWGVAPPMALATTLGLVVLGAGAYAVVLPRLRVEDPIGYWRSTVGAAAVPIAFTLLLWQGLVSHQLANLDHSVRTVVSSVGAQINAAMYRLAAAVEVVAGAQPASRRLRQEHARVMKRIIPGFQRLEWIDGEDVLRLAVSADDDLPEDGMALGDTSFDADQRAAFAKAREAGEAVVAPLFLLDDGRLGLRLVAPDTGADAPGGLVAAVVAANEFIALELEREASDFGIELRAGGILLYTRAFSGATPQTTRAVRSVLQLPSAIPWTLIVTPSPELFARIRDGIAEMLLAAGAIVALLLAVTVSTARRGGHHARALQQEVERRRATEERLHEITGDLDLRVRDRTQELEEVNAALRLENVLRLSVQQRLARSNQDLERFAAFVSHELKQPLATMAIWGDLLASSPQILLQQKGPEYVMKMRRAILRMTRLINGELALSRVSQAEMRTTRVALFDLAADVVAELGPTLERVGGRVEIGALPVVQVDPDQMRVVFRNLIENAIKYRREGVPLVVHIESTEGMGSGGDEPTCEIRVRDNGRGFPPERAEEIFDVFRRASDEGIEGSGIGLALCRRTVERHGGSIVAEGREGDGATFTIVLPLGRGEDAAQPAA